MTNFKRITLAAAFVVSVFGSASPQGKIKLAK